MKGKIIKGIAGFYYVYAKGNTYECKAKGKFRNQKVKPLVGDDVEITILDEQQMLGNIECILPRHSELIRPAVANVDQTLVVFAAAMSVQIVKVYQKDQEYARKQEQLEAQLEDETARQEDLQNYQSYTQSQEYVEDIAKSKLGLAYDNEIIFKEEP